MIKELRINIEKLSDKEQVGLLKNIFDYVSNDKLVHHSKHLILKIIKVKKRK